MIPWWLPQPSEVIGTIPERNFAWRDQELSHNQLQVLEQTNELLLLLPIFPSQQHNHHMVQLSLRGFLSNFQQSNLHPVNNKFNHVPFTVQELLPIKFWTYHHWGFDCVHEFTITIIHHDQTVWILYLHVIVNHSRWVFQINNFQQRSYPTKNAKGQDKPAECVRDQGIRITMANMRTSLHFRIMTQSKHKGQL